MRELKVSQQAEDNFRGIFRDAIKDLRAEMKICEIDSLRVSLEINRTSGARTIDLTYTMKRLESAEYNHDESTL